MIADGAGERHSYRLFGLAIESAIALPELAPASDRETAAVVIRVAPITAPDDGREGMARGDDAMLFSVTGVARFAIRGGREIAVDPAPGADPRNVRVYLLGSAMGMLLHQRGLLPLHANAVEIAGRAYAFMGHSGAGKSTLAAWFHDQGCRVIADDVCVVRFDADDRPLLYPGLPRLRLWREALEESGREAGAFEPSFNGDSDRDKFDVPLAGSKIVDRPAPLGAVYLLAVGEGFAVERLSGIDAAEALFANTYRGHYIALSGDAQAHWQACFSLIRQTPVYRVERQWGFAHMAAQNAQLLRQLAEPAD